MSLSDIERLLSSKDEEVRRSALQALTSFPAAEVRMLVFAAMGDESWRVRKEAVELFVASPPHKGDIDALIDLLRDQDNAGLRNSAAEAVIRHGAYSVEPLIRRISDPDPDVRKFIIDVMGAIGSSDFKQPLLQALSDPDVNVASAAAEHLGTIGDSTVVPELIRSIVSNEAVLFRFSALAALASLASPAPVPEEITRLAEQDTLRKAVYDCLGSIGDVSTVAILLQGVGSKLKSSRVAAIKALYRIACRTGGGSRQHIAEQLQQVCSSEFIRGVLELYNRSDIQLGEALIWFVAVCGDSAGIDLLVTAFSEERLSAQVMAAFRQFGKEGIEQLIVRYDDSDEEQKGAICALLGELGGTGAAKVLRKAVADCAAQVRMAAAVAIGKLGLTDCIPDLVALIEDSDSSVRSAVVDSLRVLALIDKSSVETLARRLCDSPDAEQRQNASALLAALGDTDRLVLLIKDESPLVRQAAIASIGRLHIASSVNLLIMTLVDEDPDVRISSAEALGELGDPGTLPALERALVDEDVWVQAAALKSVVQIAPDRLLPVVRKLYGRAEGLLAITCIDALAGDGGAEAVMIVQQFVSNPDPDISRHAASALEQMTSSRPKGHA